MAFPVTKNGNSTHCREEYAMTAYPKREVENRRFPVAALMAWKSAPLCSREHSVPHELEYGIAMTRYGVALGERWAKTN